MAALSASGVVAAPCRCTLPRKMAVKGASWSGTPAAAGSGGNKASSSSSSLSLSLRCGQRQAACNGGCRSSSSGSGSRLNSGGRSRGRRLKVQRVVVSSSVADESGSNGGSGSSSSSSSPRKVVVLGGSGRVGRSTALALARMLSPSAATVLLGSDGSFGVSGGDHTEIVIAGRDRARGEAVCAELAAVEGGPSTRFEVCDIDDRTALHRTLEGAALVVHTAGPFQRKPSCAVLEAAIQLQTPGYIDVCDDVDYSQTAKRLHSEAAAAGVRAITTTGIYPGVSNLMAAELVRLNCSPSSPASAPDDVVMSSSAAAGAGGASADTDDMSQPKSLRFSYYTAGSGGAGPTILATSFLLLGEEVLLFKDGREMYVAPYSMHRLVDFGRGLGEKSTYVLNLPEVSSAHAVLGVPTVSARFGTSPEIWNWAMQAMAALLPKEWLRDRSKVEAMVRLTDPLVRATDALSGETVSIRVDLELTNGREASALFTHRQLSVSVGQSTAAFAASLLEGACKPGVWFPEEESALTVEQRAILLRRASHGARQFLLNKAPWMLDKTPTQLGFGIYV